jgi:acyl-CoA-dependent ceramide synthase
MVYFGIYISAWIYLRHYINILIIISEFYEFKTVGPYGLVWETEQYKGDLSHWISTTLLVCLQGLNLIWLWYSGRVVYRWLVYDVQEDERSECDENELEVEERERMVKEGRAFQEES